MDALLATNNVREHRLYHADTAGNKHKLNRNSDLNAMYKMIKCADYRNASRSRSPQSLDSSPGPELES